MKESRVVLFFLLCVHASFAQFSSYCAILPPSVTIFLPHPSSCDQFVKCYGGAAVVGACPVGLQFNPNQQMCDFPEKVGCINIGGVIDYTTSAPTPAPTTEAPCPTYESCPLIDSVDRTIHLPHISNCSLFCRCDHGRPRTDRCPPGLHFNRVLQVCDWPWSAKCQGACTNLVNNVGEIWGPSTCVGSPSKIGDTCTLTCAAGYELSGSQSVQCTSGGWNGTGGLNVVPSCKTPKDLGEDFVDKINKTLEDTQACLLFILDESGSVAPSQFEMEKTFVSALVNAFPLSTGNRSAGVISFDSNAAVDVSLNTVDTCSFLKQVSSIRYNGGGTDIQLALNVAINEINKNCIFKKTLAFLITDGASSTNPTVPADTIKAGGNTLFTIGIANYERKQLEPLASSYKDGSQLFFAVSSFEVFDKVAEYLQTAYANNGVSCTNTIVIPTQTPVTSDPDSTESP